MAWHMVMTDARPGPLPLITLLAANLLPLAGVLFVGWDLPLVLYLFWAESAVIGIFAIAKLAWVAGAGAILLVPFFCAHFGLFMAVHFAFLSLVTTGDPGAGLDRSPLDMFERMQPHWTILLGSLVASHGASFAIHFLQPRAWEVLSTTDVMRAPYQRVVVMHATILLGAALAMVLGAPAWTLVLLVVMKILVDVRAHRREHRLGR